MPLTLFYPCLALFLATGALAQTWCGKNYMSSSPVVSPGGQFPTPSKSSGSLLAFRCAPAIRPYLPEDASNPAAFIVDAPITFTKVNNARDINLTTKGALGDLAVTISVDGHVLARANVPLNSTKVEVPFSLSGLTPQTKPFDVSCSATYSAVQVHTQKFTASSSLYYLPNPPKGRSVTKIDQRTGALLAKPATGEDGPYETVFPIGFYTSFDGYIATNLSALNVLKEQGFNVIHPVPSFDNLTALNAVLDRMQGLGLYLMYDMRGTYMNATSVTEQVNSIKDRPNLLLWYTGDEPDGTSDPLDATSNAYDLIYSLDGYHPVSLVLNCENYHWIEYTSGTDIVMQDAYMIGNNVTFSSQWGTVCTKDYGDCGCDNCKGDFEDISDRMDEFAERLWVEGWDRTKAVWTVPQAFGDETYWKRKPTGKEYIVEAVLGINHGGLGVVAWDDPTTADIKASASSLAKALPTLKEFILDPTATFSHVKVDRVDVGIWTVGKQTLLLATNLNYAQSTLNLDSVHAGQSVQQVFDSGASVSGREIVFESVGTGAFILS